MFVWEITKPEGYSDRKAKMHNGSIDFPYAMPGVKCCGTWASCGVLHIQCPDSLKGINEVANPQPVSPSRFQEIKNIAYEVIDSEIALEPGLHFMPLLLKEPRVKGNDFLKPDAGVLLLSSRVADIFRDKCLEYIKLVPVNNRFLIIVESNKVPPKERRSTEYCNICGRGDSVSAKSNFIIYEDMVPKNRHVFLLETTLRIFISDELKIELEKLNPTNVDFAKHDVVVS